MGGDGGSFPSRNDMVRTKGYSHSRDGKGGRGWQNNTMVFTQDRGLDSLETRELRFTQCSLSQNKLENPIVICRLGLLYNKATLIEYLIDKKIPSTFDHLKSLKKDTVDVSKCYNVKEGRFTCQITKELIPLVARSFVNWECGCVVSEKALKNVYKAAASPKCPGCNATKWVFDDSIAIPESPKDILAVVELLPTGPHLDTQLARLAALQKASKKDKKKPVESAPQEDEPAVKRVKVVLPEAPSKAEDDGVLKSLFKPTALYKPDLH